MAKHLERSVCRDMWMGRGRFSKTAIARRVAFTVPVDDSSSGPDAEKSEKGDPPIASASGPQPLEAS